jgi:hypothetical protein
MFVSDRDARLVFGSDDERPPKIPKRCSGETRMAVMGKVQQCGR